MRSVLALALVLAACGSHHHAAPASVTHPTNPLFARLVGSWNASSYAATGDYAYIPDGTTGSFTVDDTGHLVGFDALGGGLNLYLTPVGTAGDQFTGARAISGGRTETLWIYLAPVEPQDEATLGDRAGSEVGWRLTAVTAPG